MISAAPLLLLASAGRLRIDVHEHDRRRLFDAVPEVSQPQVLVGAVKSRSGSMSVWPRMMEDAWNRP
jgi:hypothetical protein